MLHPIPNGLFLAALAIDFQVFEDPPDDQEIFTRNWSFGVRESISLETPKFLPIVEDGPRGWNIPREGNVICRIYLFSRHMHVYQRHRWHFPVPFPTLLPAKSSDAMLVSLPSSLQSVYDTYVHPSDTSKWHEGDCECGTVMMGVCGKVWIRCIVNVSLLLNITIDLFWLRILPKSPPRAGPWRFLSRYFAFFSSIHDVQSFMYCHSSLSLRCW